MKISVAILSRGHPDALTGVIMSLWRLRSEHHDVDFKIGIDMDDDCPTYDAVSRLTEIPRANLTERLMGRFPARGTFENYLINLCPEADAVTLMTDRTFPITPGWDDGIARAISEAPSKGNPIPGKRLLFWSCPHDNTCAIPVIPKAWLEATDYKWSPEIFPFWWDDTWNQHVDLLIHGMPSLKIKASFSGQRGKTTRGRDFAFWLNVFNETLPLRIEQAKDMAPKLGVEWQERRDVLLYLENYAKAMASGIETIEKTFRDPNEPGPEYFVAKGAAEKMLVEMKAIREAAQ